jgi:hypothetical protein
MRGCWLNGCRVRLLQSLVRDLHTNVLLSEMLLHAEYVRLKVAGLEVKMVRPKDLTFFRNHQSFEVSIKGCCLVSRHHNCVVEIFSRIRVFYFVLGILGIHLQFDEE